MTDYVLMVRKAFPKAKDVDYGSVEIVISDTDTTGSTAVTFTNKWPVAPTVLLGNPKQTLSAYSSTGYPDRPPYYDTLTTLGMTVYIGCDTAPGQYYTTTYDITYLLIGERASQ